MARDALIVGINQYQTLPQLTAAAKDAEAIATTLETYSDFRVQRLPEIIESHHPRIGHQNSVSSQQLEESLVRLLLPKGNHIPEAVFFYFSGHGLQRERGLREGYLATSDTQPETSNSGLSLAWLRRLIRNSPVRQIVVILDCCHSGEFLSLRDEPWQGRDGHSFVFIAASREYEAAYESLDSEYSVLTEAVLSGLFPQQSTSGQVTSTDLIASITNQLRDEIQQPLFEQGGSEITITRQSERPFPQSDSFSLISRLKRYSFNFCPYRGTQSFEEKHADYFFGRETLTQELLTALQGTNIHALVGASGSGKTSLLRAGIIPRLAAGKDIAGSENWLVRYITPDPQQPLKTLATAFTLGHQEIEVANQLLQAEELLKRDANGLINLVTAALLKQPKATKFWLMIDQFEDLLVPTPDPQIEQERQQVINALVTALHSPSIPLGLAIGLRSDAIDGLLPHSQLFALLKDNQTLITPLSYQEIRDVIEKPAQKLGLKIDPYLVHNLTLDLTGAPGELALLQNTLYELWQNRTSASDGKGIPCLSLNSYMQLGRLSTIVTDRATSLYQSLPPDEQTAARRIFLALCDLGEGRSDQCRPARKLELINQQFSQSLVERVLQKLVAARLVVVDKSQLAAQPEGRAVATMAWETRAHEKAEIQRWFVTQLPTTSNALEETIELAHKSLVSDWALLRQWLTNRTLLRQQRDLEERAWLWHKRGEPKYPDYLLGQQYLKDIRQFLQTNRQDLSALAQRFVEISQRTATQQQWRNRSVAVLLPIAMMAGMTVSLVRSQITPFLRFGPGSGKTSTFQNTSAAALTPILPEALGARGTDRLAMTSQILDFNRKYPQSPISQIPVAQLSRLIKPGLTMTDLASLPNESNTLVKISNR